MEKALNILVIVFLGLDALLVGYYLPKKIAWVNVVGWVFLAAVLIINEMEG